MTNKEIITKANDLARKFYYMHGYEVKEGYRFDKATHPQEVSMWNMAVVSFEFLLETDVENCLDEEDEE